MKLRITTIALLLGTASTSACSSSTTSNDSAPCNAADAGDAAVADAGDAGGGAGPLAFTPANVDLGGIDLANVADEDVANSCQIRANGTSDCFAHAAFGTVTQSDGTKIGVYVVKSLKVEPPVHITVNALGGNLPVAIVSLGDFTLMGTIDARGQDVHANAGGFESLPNQNGFGPGGGAKGTAQTGAGGGSYCGVGGQGNVVMGSGGTPGAKTPAAGAPEIVPLRGGASGGGATDGQGGAGGGGLELVAGGTFTMTTGSYVNVGGGGGGFGATAGGGGAGGSILIQATAAKIAGTLAANGGGGGGAGAGLDSGKNGSPDATPAAGGPGAIPGAAGSGGAAIDGESAAPPAIANAASGGGGGAGRIRIDSKTGQADLTGAVLSPPASTPCVTQGAVK